MTNSFTGVIMIVVIKITNRKTEDLRSAEDYSLCRLGELVFQAEIKELTLTQKA